MTFAILAAPLLLFGAPPSATTQAPDAPQAPEESATPPAASEQAPRTALNQVFFEALGSGLLYSVNYERILDRWNIGLRGGVSYFTYGVNKYQQSGNLTIVSFPVLASWYYTLHRGHHLQLGLGATVFYTDVATDSQGVKFDAERSGLGLAASAVVGYRYMPRDGGVSFGVGFTPLVRASKLLPWGGANVGYSF